MGSRAFLLAAVLAAVLAVAPATPAVPLPADLIAGSGDELNTMHGFWHYAVAEDESAPAELVWAPFPGESEAPGGTLGYALQRWPSPDMPAPGQAGYLASLLHAEQQHDAAEGVYMAVDPGQGSSTGATAAHPYYRVLALDSSGRPLAATRPAQAASAKGNVFVSNRPCNGGPCRKLLAQPSIQDAITAAAPGATVNILPGVYTHSAGGNTNLVFGKKITLQGVAGPEGTVIDCQNAARAFDFTGADGMDTVVKGFRVINGFGEAGGGAIVSDGSPTITDCEFQYCRAADANGHGGAMFVGGLGAKPLLRGCRFLDNYAFSGGAIAVMEGAAITVENSTIARNRVAAGLGRGGGVLFYNSQPSTIRDSVLRDGSAGFSGGGMSAEIAATILLERVQVINNTASTFAAGILLWGSNMTAINTDWLNNTADLWGGGVHAQYGFYNATNCRHNGNRAAWGGGGGVLQYASVVLMKNCEVKNNMAIHGAGFEVKWIEAGKSEVGVHVPTILSVNDSVVDGNMATDRGAAYNVESADLVAFVNVSITNNVAATKGAGGYTAASNPVQLVQALVQNNQAPVGAGLFVMGPGSAKVLFSQFVENSASLYGAAIAVGDNGTLDATMSQFRGNGGASCRFANPPVGGGAIFVGVEAFDSSTECDAVANISYARVSLNSVLFQGNQALDRGGAVHVVAGSLQMDTVEFLENSALGISQFNTGNYDGVGGAIALDERCPEGVCAPVNAELTNVRIASNSARLAGGALYYAGSHAYSALAISQTVITNNTVDMAAHGVGGGLYLGRDSFTVAASAVTENTAFNGGGLFVSANISADKTTLVYLNLTSNVVKGMGQAAFWLRSKSTASELSCLDCVVPPVQAAFATEVLVMQYGSQQPTLVQTNRDFPQFSVELLDYYNNTMCTESGTCSAKLSEAEPTATLNPRGQDERAVEGVANFTSLQLKGTINRSYKLEIGFSRASGGASKFLSINPLQPLSLPVTIAPCAPGSQPNSEQNDCAECPAGLYNLDGSTCLKCPKGAECRGGDTIESKEDFWRWDNQTATFYACKMSGVCLAGKEAGNAACKEGQRGPLCDVCQDDWFKFAGSCKECSSNGQAKAMLAVTVIAFVLVAAALFARNWGSGVTGPGIMTKVKIFLTHFQMLALFRDYDVLWHGATDSALGWFEVLNIGFSMLAPECFFGSYNFYWLYIFQMVLPFASVATCVAFYHSADLALRRVDPTGEQRAAGDDAPRLVRWLEGLKLRCWKNTFWFVTLLYPRCAMTALQLFGWQSLGNGTYLEADYSIMVKTASGSFKSPYLKYMVPGILLLILFALVIPGVWFAAVFVNRHRLEDPAVQAKYGFLYSSYSPRLPYWETTEMLRKFLVAFIPVFIPTQVDGSVQAAVAQIVLLVYMLLTIRLWPFAAPEDNWLQLASLAVLWILLLSAGVNKWADLSDSGSDALAGGQLALSSGVGFLLGCAVLYSAAGLARKFSHKLSNKRKASRAASRAAKEEGGADGGNGGSSGGADKRASASSIGKASWKRGSLGAISEIDGGEIAADHAGLPSGKAAAAGALPTVNVIASGQAAGDEEAGMSPYADDTLRGKRHLLRTSSSMSRRSAADDAEMRVPADGVQRSDSSTLPGVRPSLAGHS